MKTLIRILFFAAFFFQSCNSDSKKQDSSLKIETKKVIANQNNSSVAFKKFVSKFKVLQLPLDIQTLKIVADSNQKFTASDNLFVKSQYPNEIYAYGLLTDTVDNYKFIWLEPAEIEVPVIATFTKSGKFIKKEYLGVGQCGSDCCYDCNEYIHINKDLTIVSSDSIKSCKCDKNGPIANTSKKYVLVKNGSISKTGRITMTDFIKKDVN